MKDVKTYSLPLGGLALAAILILTLHCSGAQQPAEISDQGVVLDTFSYDETEGVLSGTVKNTSETGFRTVWLMFDLFDDQGNKIGTARPNTVAGPPVITTLDPGGSWSFNLRLPIFPGHRNKAASVKPVGIRAEALREGES